MSFVRGFPPVAGRTARVLILGSMPGVASLAARRYYANPHNAFWRVLGAVCGFEHERPYRERLAALRRHGIALWDVLHRCERDGSLDSDIDPRSMVVNDFATFFAEHAGIRAVLCNGGTAMRLFERAVVPTLGSRFAALARVRLPSTSPANAGMRLPQKIAAWRAALLPCLQARAVPRPRLVCGP